MFEDRVGNLVVPHQLGMKTVLVVEPSVGGVAAGPVGGCSAPGPAATAGAGEPPSSTLLIGVARSPHCRQ